MAFPCDPLSTLTPGVGSPHPTQVQRAISTGKLSPDPINTSDVLYSVGMGGRRQGVWRTSWTEMTYASVRFFGFVAPTLADRSLARVQIDLSRYGQRTSCMPGKNLCVQTDGQAQRKLSRSVGGWSAGHVSDSSAGDVGEALGYCRQ